MTNSQAAEIAKPCVQPLDLPATLVPSQRPAILRSRLHPINPVGTNELNAALGQIISERIAVICAIGDNPLHPLPRPPSPGPWNTHIRKCFRCQLHLRWRGRSQVGAQRTPLPVRHHHPFRPFPPLRFSHSRAPFFAEANEPSMNASFQSNRPRPSSSPRNERHIFSHIPISSQSFSRRQQVTGAGYCSGRACHCAPVRNTQRIPSMHRRSSIHGRPRLSARRCSFGIRGSIFFHCRSVSMGPSAIVTAPSIQERGVAVKRPVAVSIPDYHCFNMKRKYLRNGF